MNNKKIKYIILMFFLTINITNASWVDGNDISSNGNTQYNIVNNFTKYIFDPVDNNNNLFSIQKEENIHTYLATELVPYNRYSSQTSFTGDRRSQGKLPAVNYTVDSHTEVIANNYHNSKIMLDNGCSDTGILYTGVDVFGNNNIYSYCDLSIDSYEFGNRYTVAAKTYKYDTTKPRGNGVRCTLRGLRDDNGNPQTDSNPSDSNPLYELGIWTNQVVDCRVECIDLGSKCNPDSTYESQSEEEFAKPKTFTISGLPVVYSRFDGNIGYKGNIQAPMEDIAGNRSFIKSPELDENKILTDFTSPSFSGITVDTVPQIITSNTVTSIGLIPGNHDFEFTFVDSIKGGGGISGIKNYSFKLVRTHDSSGNEVTPEDVITNYTSNTIDPWNPLGEDVNDHVLTYSINDLNIVGTGKYTLTFTASDRAGNSGTIYQKFEVFPSKPCVSGSDLTKIELVSANGSVYANDVDEYIYKLTLKDCFGNPIYNKALVSNNGLSFNITDPTSYIGGKKILLDNIDHSGDYGLGISVKGPSNNDGEITIGVRSVSPGVFTERFKLIVAKYGNNYVQDDFNIGFDPLYIINSTGTSENTFKKPFTSELYASNNAGVSWDSIPEVGGNYDFKLKLKNPGNVTGYNQSNINISESNIYNIIDGHVWDGNFTNKDYTFDEDDENVYFSAKINSIDNDLVKPIINTKNLEIKYNIGGKDIRFSLTNGDSYNDNTPSTIGGGIDSTNLGLKVIGNSQGRGNIVRSGQESNFSDLSKLDLRQKIRQNAYELIKGMNSGDIVNGVKYIEGEDYTVNGNISNFETLVIKNGNLVITKDILNKVGNKLGFIVIKDGYDIHDGYNGKGNILIDKNVKYINAAFYSDGAILSSDGNIPFLENNNTRSSALLNQLIIKGSIFTRNTIGGMLLDSVSNKYSLPGGEKLDNTDINRDLSFIYDLNFIRVSNKYWDPNNDGSGNEFNDGLDDNFIIKYNPSIQTNPPKGFGK